MARDKLVDYVPVASGLNRMGREMDSEGFNMHWGKEKKEGDT